MRIFSCSAVNCGRQTEADLLRGFTALIIIICHVGLYLGDPTDTFLYTFSDIIGSEFGAPVFMALMGIGIAYSRRQAPADLYKRGIRLLIAGYALSAYRSLLPLWILGQVDEWTSVEAFFVVDILQFAGLSFLLFALLKKCKVPSFAILGISVVMVFVNQFIMLPASVPWDSQLLTGFVNLFCPITSWSCFPFFTWFFFPTFGLCLGDMLRHCTDKKSLYAIMLPVGFLGVAFVYGQFHFLYPDYVNYYWGGNFYYMGVVNVLLTGCFICFALAFWFFVEKILPAFIKNFLVFLSKNLNVFYIFSWVFISALIHVQAYTGLALRAPYAAGMTVSLTALCTVCTKLWISVKKRYAEKRSIDRQSRKT